MAASVANVDDDELIPWPTWSQPFDIAIKIQKAQQEIGDMVKNLPELQDSIHASTKVIEATRKNLELILKGAGKILQRLLLVIDVEDGKLFIVVKILHNAFG